MLKKWEGRFHIFPYSFLHHGSVDVLNFSEKSPWFKHKLNKYMYNLKDALIFWAIFGSFIEYQSFVRRSDITMRQLASADINNTCASNQLFSSEQTMAFLKASNGRKFKIYLRGDITIFIYFFICLTEPLITYFFYAKPILLLKNNMNDKSQESLLKVSQGKLHVRED